MIIGRRFKIVHVFFEHLNQERSLKYGKPKYERHVLEVSTYRSNKVNPQALSEHGRILVDNNYGTMDEDAFRRDFTVNALYYDPIAETITDYHDGLEDIQKKLIRVIGNPHERYLEDPVRILRAIRLSEKLDLKVDENTYISFRNVKNLLLNEPKGRLFEEMLKILMSGHAVKIVRELNELGLPRRVFSLFDKLFFNGNKDEFAYKILALTDLRLANDEDISLTFILSGLIWPAIWQSWQQERENTHHLRQALIDAIAKNRNIVFNSGITRNLYSAMREIWFMQVDFDVPNIAKFEQLLSNPRFRQAWHLFNLRHEFGQTSVEVFTWWSNYMSVAEADRTELLVELVDIAPHDIKKKKKRRRSRNKSKFAHHAVAE